MSSSDRLTRRSALLALAALPALALGGCFRPMYAPPAGGGPGLSERLATISVEEIPNRLGIEFRNALLFDLTGGGQAPAPVYTLNVAITSSQQNSIIDAQTNKPQVDSVRLDAVFSLKEIGTDKIILTGKQFALTTFDRSLQRFAAVRAARDAENRAAKLLAEQIRTQIAIHFSKQG